METKPAYKTTEFWTMVVVNFVSFLNASNIWSFVPHRWSVILSAVTTGLYALARGQAKQGQPYTGGK